MKNIVPIQAVKADPAVPSLFQVAAQLEDFTVAHPKAVPQLKQKMPNTDLMLHPEKIAAALKTAETELPAENQPAKPAQKNAKVRRQKISSLAAAPFAQAADLQETKTTKTKKGKL